MIDPNISPIATLLFSACTLLVTILLYRRNASFENENHIYKLKMQAYALILREISTLLNFWQNNYIKLHDKSFNLYNDDKLKYELFEDLNQKIDIFQELIIEQSIYMSEKCYKLIDNYLNLLIESLPHYNEKDENMDEILNKLFALSNQININKREELLIDELSNSLFKRLKK